MHMISFTNRSRIFIGLAAALLLFIALFGNSISSLAANEQNTDGRTPHSNLIVKLTDDERAWLKNHPVVRVAGPKEFPPFHYYENDEPQGMAAEYVSYIMARLGIRIEIVPNKPWPEVLNGAKNKQIDIIACSAKSADRENYLLFSNSYLSFPLVIINRKEAPFVGGLNDLHGKKVALIKKVSTREWLERDKIAVIPHVVDTPLEGLKAVSHGKADAYIGNLATVTHLIEKNGLANLKVAAPTSYDLYDLFIAVRDDWPLMASSIDKALNAMTAEQHSAIRNRWLSVRYEHGISWKVFLEWIFGISGVAVLILAVILFWNRKLNQEILERKRVETKLRITQFSVDHAGDAIYWMAADGGFVYVNESACKALGYTEEELLSMAVYDIDESVTAESWLTLWNDLKRKKSLISETTHRSKSGRMYGVEIAFNYLALADREYNFAYARDITERKKSEQEREKLISELRTALAEIRTLRGFLPICSNCKRVRDDEGYWNQIDAYIQNHSDIEFSHSICPECAQKLYPELLKKQS